MDPLAVSLKRSPELFPHTLDVAIDSVRLIRLTEGDYARASFLDGRVLTPHTVGRSLAWPQLAGAVEAAELSEDCFFIFHIGHVGSTLLSRLLGAAPRILALREPAILRMLAQVRAEPESQPRRWDDIEFEQRLSLFLKLWSRTFRPEQRAVIKATSFVSELAAEILSRSSVPKTIFMFAPAETWLATIFGGENSRQEAKALAPSRLDRLHARIGDRLWNPADLSEGETIAMGWACEMSALGAAAAIAGDRVLWLDFDRFLKNPAAGLCLAFNRFNVDPAPSDLETILAGPNMRRYSKAPEHVYDASIRREVLDFARREHASEIARGLSWLGRAAADFPAIFGAMDFAR